MKVEDTGFLFASCRTEPLTGLREVPGDGLDSLFEPLELGSDLILRYPVPLGSGLPVAGTNAGPTATPSDAPMPVNFTSFVRV